MENWNQMTTQSILEFIASRWDKTTRTNVESKGNLIGLPYPYTVPALEAFQELYYWDTYFAARGMIPQGFAAQVKNNCDDFIYEIEQFGFIPNGNRTFYLNRSQPPYFGSLVELVHGHFKDIEWLRKAVAALEKEQAFWTTRRKLPCGLSRYGQHEKDDAVFEDFYKHCCVDRLKMDPDADSHARRLDSEHTMAEAESGWDFNPRFERRCMDYAPIDLNSLLFKNEELLAKFHEELGDSAAAAEWRRRAAARKELICKLCWSEGRGAFMDYDSVGRRLSPVLSAASLQPLWCGLATQTQAASTVKAMEASLEFAHGLSACERYDSGIAYQWDYPNGWPCLQIVAIDALSLYGFKEQARRIAEKYIDTASRCFEISGELWEKYNVVSGAIDVKDEYKMPALMGWSAAAFVVAAGHLAKR